MDDLVEWIRVPCGKMLLITINDFMKVESSVLVKGMKSYDE